jgi:hypothetical protein
MRDLNTLSREEAINYLKLVSGLALAVDGLWFMAAEKASGYDKALDMDVDVWVGYARVVVKRIRRNFQISGTGIEALKEIIQHDPMWWSMGDVKTTEDSPSRFGF